MLTSACWRSRRSACSWADSARVISGRVAHHHVAAVVLRPVERAVGEPVERVGVGGLGDVAHPGGHRHPADRGEVGVRDAPAHALGRLQGLVGVGLGQDHGELLAADPGHQLARPRLGREHVRGVLEHPVAHLVAVHVVDALEVVEVHQHQRQAALAAAGALHLGPQALVEGAVVGEAGQRVDRRALLRGRQLSGPAPRRACAAP